MEKIKRYTVFFLIALITIGIVYDVYAIMAGGTEATISWVTWTAFKNYPIMSLTFGIVIGHLTWQMNPRVICPKCKNQFRVYSNEIHTIDKKES